MNAVYPFVAVKYDAFHSAVRNRRLQPWAWIFLLLSACSTVPPPPAADLNAVLPEGLYHFTSETVNQNNLARIRHVEGKFRVELLGDFDGGFALELKDGNTLQIVDAEMDYPGLRRSYKGTGNVVQPGLASGTDTMWLKTTGPISRNHRDGTWTLRPATEDEIRRYERKQLQLEERRRRAAGNG